MRDSCLLYFFHFETENTKLSSKVDGIYTKKNRDWFAVELTTFASRSVSAFKVVVGGG